jgi:cytochrome c oxidase subunit IV
MEKMKKKKANKLNFVAKILAILYILFITLFVFDAENFLGLLIHLLPTFIFLICFIVALFRTKIGGILFVLSGIGTMIFFKTYQGIISFILILAIPILIGLMFYLSEKK